MAGIEGSTSDLIGNVLGQLGGGEPPLVRGESGGGAVRRGCAGGSSWGGPWAE